MARRPRPERWREHGDHHEAGPAADARHVEEHTTLDDERDPASERSPAPVSDQEWSPADEVGADVQDDDRQEDGQPGAEPPEERLRQLVSFLASNLVDNPAVVEVEAERRGGSVLVTLRVPEEELGRVIGRQGRIARAMRTVIMIAGSRHNLRASLDIEG